MYGVVVAPDVRQVSEKTGKLLSEAAHVTQPDPDGGLVAICVPGCQAARVPWRIELVPCAARRARLSDCQIVEDNIHVRSDLRRAASLASSDVRRCKARQRDPANHDDAGRFMYVALRHTLSPVAARTSASEEPD